MRESGVAYQPLSINRHQRDGEGVRIPQRSNDKLLCAVAVGVILKSCSGDLLRLQATVSSTLETNLKA